MTLLALSGYIIIAGFVLVVAASLAAPRAVYSAEDKEARLEIIAQNRSRWTTSNALWAVTSLVTAVGMLLLSISLAESQSPGLLYAGAAAIVIGAVSWDIYLYQVNADPAEYLYSDPPAPLSIVFVWATVAALALYAVAFLQGSFPDWLGYVLLVSMALPVVGLVFFFKQFYENFPPQFFYILTLVVGIAALTQ
jgi:hypothetical protein